jgi:hypothetical protein
MPPSIVIKFSDSVAASMCGLCGVTIPTEPSYGPELFLEGTMTPICRTCGRAYAPQLLHIIKLYWAGRQQDDTEAEKHARQDAEQLFCDIETARLARGEVALTIEQRYYLGDDMWSTFIAVGPQRDGSRFVFYLEACDVFDTSFSLEPPVYAITADGAIYEYYADDATVAPTEMTVRDLRAYGPREHRTLQQQREDEGRASPWNTDNLPF